MPCHVITLLLLLLLLQVRGHGLAAVGAEGTTLGGAPHEKPHSEPAAALRSGSSSSEVDVERVAAHMLAQEGVSVDIMSS
jgi:hypothetical protein